MKKLLKSVLLLALVTTSSFAAAKPGTILGDQVSTTSAAGSDDPGVMIGD